MPKTPTSTPAQYQRQMQEPHFSVNENSDRTSSLPTTGTTALSFHL
ncbi:MAG: hypothetical protein KME25_18030 [Symplocastrum torsivum CPER-KK1]|uniref:Uncharacterized protein n=1 Tax=Symplocastrum torsivum CPER-KK1 TaxID=450513 RepID=A0A951PMH8_9CYAN|nr:hypothetical protein [Symplocastrum torsivum CPER-KK1]